MNWIMQWWNKHCREIDFTILWPVCKEHARDLEEARMAFFVHTQMDSAWSDLEQAQVIDLINHRCV